jgi:thiosulfate/3-mercaptopyruvate sulfurtransferase
LDGVVSALVSADDLAALLGQNPVVVLDVQYELLGPPGAHLHAAGHIPGAPHLDLDEALAGPPGRGGRHPLPDPRALESALRACGVDDDSDVVVYDQRTSLAAGRAWWTLRWAGHPQVRVLDGGLEAWRRAGHPVTTDVPAPARGDIRVRPGSVPVLDADGAVAMTRGGVLLDVRAPERYRGEAEPIDPVAGHVPGSVNLPATDLLAEDGTFLSTVDIRRRAAEVGIHRDTPVGTSCGSGVTAAQTALALHEAGLTAVPYIGSWSEWVADPDRPVATGADPG